MRSRSTNPAPTDREQADGSTHHFFNQTTGGLGEWDFASSAFSEPNEAIGDGNANDTSSAGTWHPPSLLTSTSTTAGMAAGPSTVSASSHTPISGVDRRSKKASKRRKKKPKDKPKRPLSAYNIFFRDERLLILNAIDEQTDNKKQAASAEGLAKQNNDDMLMFLSPIYSEFDGGIGGGIGDEALFPVLNEEELKTILPSTGLTSECCTGGQPHNNKKVPHGKISFEDLAKVIGGRWKKLPQERIAYYKDLAEKDAERYRIQMEEYNKKIAESQKLEKPDNEKSPATQNLVVAGNNVEDVVVPLVLEELKEKVQENRKTFDDFSNIFSNCPSPVAKESIQTELPSLQRNEEFAQVVLDANDPEINHPIRDAPLCLSQPNAKKAKVQEQVKEAATISPKMGQEEIAQQAHVQNTEPGSTFSTPMFNNIPVYSFGQGFNPFQCMIPTMGGMAPTMGGVMNYPMMMPHAQQHAAPMMLPMQHMGDPNQSMAMMDQHGNTKTFHLMYAAVPVPHQSPHQMMGFGMPQAMMNRGDESKSSKNRRKSR